MKKLLNSLWLSKKMIETCSSDERKVYFAQTDDYSCTFYDMKLDVLTFSNMSLKIPFTIIAPPASVDKQGYEGDLNMLIKDFKKKKGNFLILNLDSEKMKKLPQGIACGKTLHSTMFENKFSTFEEYLNALRSNHRRRIKKALLAFEEIDVRKISPREFDDNLYKLYLNVLEKSEFKLETLPKSFFENEELENFVFYKDNIPISFASTYCDEDEFDFIFGGMDYNYLKKYDLYYNMLLFIIKEGILKKKPEINLGQTALYAKTFVGAQAKDRYMLCFSSNYIIDFFVKKFSFLLENSEKIPKSNPFK